MTALEELTKPAASLTNSYIGRWKEKGGKVIGYFCTYGIWTANQKLPGYHFLIRCNRYSKIKRVTKK